MDPDPQAPPQSEPPTPVGAAPRPGVVQRMLGWVRSHNDATQARWDAVLEIPRIRRTRFLAKVVAIHARYTCGYLMTGFLVSAPIQLGRGHEGGGAIFKSIFLGSAFLLPFVALIPFTRIAWEKMRLPEFKNLELGLTRWATIASVAFLALTGLVQLFADPQGPVAWLFDPHIAWVNLGLMAFAWVRIQFDAWLFREFYTLHPDDDTLVLFRLPQDMRERAAAPCVDLAPPPADAPAPASEPAAIEPTEGPRAGAPEAAQASPLAAATAAPADRDVVPPPD